MINLKFPRDEVMNQIDQSSSKEETLKGESLHFLTLQRGISSFFFLIEKTAQRRIKTEREGGGVTPPRIFLPVHPQKHRRRPPQLQGNSGPGAGWPQ